MSNIDKMQFLGERILFLGCHLDDIEYGCGGIISKLIAENKVFIKACIFTDHNEDAEGNIQLVRDIPEAERAMKKLGLDQCYEIYNFPGQKMEYKKQEIREKLLEIRRNFQPTSVFYPAKSDIHQDHYTLANEAYRIFRNGNCYGYEVIRSTTRFEPNLYISLSDEYVQQKINAIMEYQSQLTQSAGYYFREEVIRSIAVFRGTQVGLTYAEAFEIYMQIQN